MISKTICYYLDASELCDAKRYQHALRQIPWQERLDAIQKYRFEKEKRLSLGAGLLLQYALTLAGVQNKKLKYGTYGKPMLADRDEQVFFNCSHSENLVVCAVSDGAVGVDAEKVSPVDKRIISECFTPKEQEWIGNEEEHFYRLWTRKESYLKFTGEGMMTPPQSVCVLENESSLNCRFTEYSLQNYKIAVCGNECSALLKVEAADILGSS